MDPTAFSTLLLDESQDVEALTARFSARLKDLEAKKEETERELDRLEDEIDRTKRRLEELTSLDGSDYTQTLPEEIVREIFSVACEGEWILFAENLGRDDSSFRQTTAVALSHVCRRWYKIADSCPRLWTRLSLTNLDELRPGGYGEDEPLPSFLAFLKVVLRRSKSLPLHLTLNPLPCYDAEDGIGYFGWPPFWGVLLESRHRWSSFEAVQSADPFGPSTNTNCISFPVLSNLRIQLCELDQDLSYHFPNLTNLFLDNAVNVSAKTFIGSFPRLVNLTIFSRLNLGLPNVSPGILFDLLKASPSLETLRLNFGDTGPDVDHDGRPFRPITLPSLRTLELQHSYAEFYASTLLPNLSTPVLENIDLLEIAVAMDPNALTEFLSPAKVPRLKQLRIVIGNPYFFDGDYGDPEWAGYLQSNSRADWVKWSTAVSGAGSLGKKKRIVRNTFTKTELPLLEHEVLYMDRKDYMEDHIGWLLAEKEDDDEPAGHSDVWDQVYGDEMEALEGILDLFKTSFTEEVARTLIFIL
ncbi:hypothetical protein CC1G_08563 [Coprinopsis cinerea okayama7|uniref:F-box domain-containing protein n=1 Tax=Coprinopsis cinerea (strain Okayama-7 / 130 / ATCC MYA-4618 / FGSC 9003) TaxID=240176 RepID=A8NCS1_COPC7|nr:hypothetical protein CC1G_08563 [Coprinopsis cinerea okayama7\|eukprot:XP_001832613.2 hypothetical protein CC1G_08563 [Coprinopsis cinerea okayama7\